MASTDIPLFLQVNNERQSLISEEIVDPQRFPEFENKVIDYDPRIFKSILSSFVKLALQEISGIHYAIFTSLAATDLQTPPILKEILDNLKSRSIRMAAGRLVGKLNEMEEHCTQGKWLRLEACLDGLTEEILTFKFRLEKFLQVLKELLLKETEKEKGKRKSGDGSSSSAL